MSCSCNDALTVMGYATFLYITFKIFKFLQRVYKESLWSTTTDFKKYGSWAIVTGASDGIGKGIAVELAKCGMNIVIIARTKSKLDQLADELRKEHEIQVKTIAIDFTEDGHIYDIIKEEIENLDIGILVNNVGIAFTEPLWFLRVPNHIEYSKNIVRVNILAMLKMSEIVLPDMLKKGRGIIVNVSSVVGSRGSPFMSLYGATKKLIITFTESMSQEYQKKGLIFQCLVPASTATPMTAKSIAGSEGALVPTAETYGRYAVKSFGKSTYTNTALFFHNFVQIFLWMIPDFLYVKILKSKVEITLKHLKQE